MKQFGSPSSELVLLLHGGPGTPDYLEEVAQLLRPDWLAASFDQRGTGQSVASNHSYTIKEYLEDIEGTARYFGKSAFHLFGHSWGGLLAQLFALQYPERVKSLFLCNPAPGPGRQWLAMLAEESLYILRKTNFSGLRQLSSAYLQGQFGDSDEGWQQFYTLVWRYYFADTDQAPTLAKEWLAGVRAEAVRKTVQSILSASPKILGPPKPSFPIPIGILYGEDDFLQRCRKPVLKRFVTAKVYEVKGAGHVPWVGNPADFRKYLNEFYEQFG